MDTDATTFPTKERRRMSKATEPTYRIRTLVNGEQEWQDDPIVAGTDYLIGDDLATTARDLAVWAYRNTQWVTEPQSIQLEIQDLAGDVLAVGGCAR
jgi:hypothetical protein